jgi:ABC-2 type transport system ATP-binding protein
MTQPEPSTPTVAPLRTEALCHRYGRVQALRDVDLEVRAGEVYALLGPNGAGKTTLIQILMGLRRPTSGNAWVFGRAPRSLAPEDRAAIAYVAEGRALPSWMRLGQLESFLRPLYPTWDEALAEHLRQRFALDRDRKISTLSRGEHMKAALLTALAPRPRLLVMDEPFAGMDVMVRDELVRGLLETSGTEGWTVLLASHEVSELELLADRVGILRDGRLVLSQSMDRIRDRFRAVEVTLPESADPLGGTGFPASWGRVEAAGRRLRFVVDEPSGSDRSTERLRTHLPAGSHIDARGASLKEAFVRMAERPGGEDGP